MKELIFALVMTLSNGESYVLDSGLSAEDCATAVAEFPIVLVTAGAIKLDCMIQPIRFEDSDSVE